jgi:hypothetical protein
MTQKRAVLSYVMAEANVYWLMHDHDGDNYLLLKDCATATRTLNTEV